MAIIGASVPTLVDITKRLDPDGKVADIAELLTQENEVLQDMTWKEGNLPTGERTTVRTGLPTVGYRRLNEGVPTSKSTTAQIDDGAAMLEGYSEVDRKLAILSGNPAQYRLDESRQFFEAMNQAMARTLFYGDAAASPKEFTGLAARYADAAAETGANIIDGGGEGADNRSIWLVVWDVNKITGIYPKGTKAGLFHEDATANKQLAGDGYPVGDVLRDGAGNPYQGYIDHYEWNCGLSVKDWRYAARIANIDVAGLTRDASSGADLTDLMIQATERVQSLNGRAAFYVPRVVSGFLRRQILNGRNVFLSIEEVAGKRATMFDGIPVRRVDALNFAEPRVG
jgi:hypothetical protein